MNMAQSIRVRWSVTCTVRLPANGSTAMKMLAVPRRSYSLSYLATSPGRGGSGSRTSAINCLLHSSMQTMGRLGSCGRWYTSNTSSIAATNSAEGPVGKHQPFFNHGLSSFFLASAAPSRRKVLPRIPTPPCDPPTAAASTASGPPADYRRPEPPDELPPCHRADARKHASSAGAATQPPVRLRRIVAARVRLWLMLDSRVVDLRMVYTDDIPFPNA